MKDNLQIAGGVCPRCGQIFMGRPAISRRDNITLICPDCGTREALESIGVKPQEQDEIIAVIHSCYGRGRQSEDIWQKP